MKEFKMPALGADMDKGTLLAWHVKPGDRVERGDIVADVETQKGTIEVEIWHSGIVAEMRVRVGQEAAVGTVLALIAEEDDAYERGARPSAHAAAQPSAPPEQPRGSAQGESAVLPGKVERAAVGERVRISPLARKLAAAHGIAPSSLKGSGEHGAITRADVERRVQENAARQTAAQPQVRADQAKAMRAAIAASMSRSKREIPHYYLQTTVNVHRALAWLDSLNAGTSTGERILPIALYMKATALACARVPEMNGFWQEGAFVPHPHVHIGLAISLRQGGVVAPAIHRVEDKSLVEVMAAIVDLVTRARAGKLRSSEISDPTITITSLGEQGVESVYGVIYPPQVAMLGIGAIRMHAWADEEGMLGARPVVAISLSADHRVSDGHRGGVFLAYLGNVLTDPARYLCAEAKNT